MEEKEISSFWITNLETGETTKAKKGSVIETTIAQPVYEQSKLVYHFNKEYWDKPMTITLKNAYWDLSRVHTNNWRRMHGMNPLPYRKMFKHDAKYALTIYNKQRKYIRDRYTFEDWRKMKGIN